MKRWMVWLMAISLMGNLQAQKKWDGGGASGDWNNAQNWYPDGLPIATDSVVLDNSYVSGNYTVNLPGGNVTTQVKTLLIQSNAGVITLIIPSTNTGAPGFQVNGSGDALVIGDQCVFKNSSGASAGNTLTVTGNIRINNGGKYTHQTIRSNATVIDRLSTAAGTEKGIFEFDVPSTAGYTVSLSNNTFGSLVFRALASNGNKPYSGSGSSNLTIRGDLVVDTGVQLTSTVVADIVVNGKLDISGKFSLNPSSAGTSGRSLKLSGSNVMVKGLGSLLMNTNFRNIEITRGAGVTMQRNLQLINTVHALLNYGTLDLGNFYLWGDGKYVQQDSAILYNGAVAGISKSKDSGAVRTVQQSFSKKAGYHFNGNNLQTIGTGFPDSVATLGINNAAHCSITSSVCVTDSLVLIKGNFITDSLHLIQFAGKKIRSNSNQWGERIGGWEESYIQGPFQINLMDTTTVYVPIGKSSYAPLKIKNTIARKNKLLLEYLEAAHAIQNRESNISAINNNGYWNIQSIDGDALHTSVSVGFKQSENNLTAGATLKPFVLNTKETNPLWKTAIGNYIGNSEKGWIVMDSTTTDFQSLSFGYAQTTGLLPIKTPVLEYVIKQDLVLLSWQNLNQQAQVEYILERSTDGKYFEEVYQEKNKLFNNQTFQWIDYLPKKGSYFYRLKEIATDETSYSNTLVVKSKNEGKPYLVGNSVNDQLKIIFPGSCSEYHLQIVNTNGFVLYQTFVNTNYFETRVSSLKSGIYFVRLFGNQQSFTLSFFKF